MRLHLTFLVSSLPPELLYVLALLYYAKMVSLYSMQLGPTR